MVFKIKSEDKAAFLNRLEKQDVALNSSQIKDNKLEGYFEVTIDNPEQLEIAKTILKQSPKINTIKEMKKKLTKDELKEMVRQELQGVLAEKKKAKDEDDEKKKLDEALMDFAWVPGLAAFLGISAVILKGIFAYMKQNNLKGIKGFIEAYNKVGSEASSSIDRSMGTPK